LQQYTWYAATLLLAGLQGGAGRKPRANQQEMPPPRANQQEMKLRVAKGMGVVI